MYGSLEIAYHIVMHRMFEFTHTHTHTHTYTQINKQVFAIIGILMGKGKLKCWKRARVKPIEKGT